MRKIFFKTLENIAKEDKSIFLLVGDLGGKFFPDFQKIDYKRFLNVGIAEQNMIGMASGLALSGKNVYCYSIAPFLITRTLEHIKNDICYANLPVKLLGAGGGLVYGFEGVTHHAIEDMAIMRALPNMTVVAPGDAKEAEALALASASFPGPLYIRFGRDIDPIVHQNNLQFKIGKGIVVKQGKDNNICIMATGTMLYPGTLVSDILEKQGFSPTLISLHTIKPLDKELIQDCAKNYKSIFTLEEHNIIGGLGSAVAEVLAEINHKGLFKRIGIQDQFSSVVGSPQYLLEKLGLTPEKMAETILNHYSR